MKRLILAVSLMMIALAFEVRAEQAAAPADDTSLIKMLLEDSSVKDAVNSLVDGRAPRYGLTPEQTTAFRDMMQKNIQQFVKKHYAAFLKFDPQLDDMQGRLGANKKVSPDEVKAMGSRISPIFNEAANMVMETHTTFHEFLDETQKAKHQPDMDLMRKNIKEMQKRIAQWQEGKYPKEGDFTDVVFTVLFDPFPEAPPVKAGDKKPDDQNQPLWEPDVTSPTSVSYWEMYTKKFCEAFGLNEDQKTMAYSVLKDKKVEAKAFREDHSREFAEVKKYLDLFHKTGTLHPETDLKPWQGKLDKLETPLLNMFTDLTERLMAIPTEEQKKAAQAILSEE